MSLRCTLKLWDGTEVSRPVRGLADAVRGYYWDDIVSIRINDNNGIDQTWCEEEFFEACRHTEHARNVAEKCIWSKVEGNLWSLYKKIRKKKIKECKIL